MLQVPVLLVPRLVPELQVCKNVSPHGTEALLVVGGVDCECQNFCAAALLTT
jgi:hypothetical protein